MDSEEYFKKVEMNKSGVSNIISGMHSGLRSLDMKLEQTTDIQEKKKLLQEKFDLYYKKFDEAIAEISSDVAAVNILVKNLVKANQEIMDLTGHMIPEDEAQNG